MTTLAAPQNGRLALADWQSFATLERAWTLSCIGYVALAAVCLAAQWFDARLLDGVSVWSKPFKFALSLSVYFATLVWCWQFVPQSIRRSLTGRWLVYLPTCVAFAEMAYITVQGAQGEASHFNYTTTIHALAYSLMGFGAVTLVSILVWLAWLIGRHNPLSQPLIAATIVGLLLTFILGGGFGGYISLHGSHWVSAPHTDANGSWLFNWTQQGGDLRVAHFFGMHAMQVIPAIALLLPRSWDSHVRLSLVVTFSTAYAALCCMTFWQAIDGQPFLA